MATARARAAAPRALDFTVKPLFAEPYFVTNIRHAISAEQVALLKALPMLDNQVNKISEELYLFDRPELASIREAVDAALQTYAREVLGIAQRLEVTQSWTLINPPGVGMHGHTHSNSLVSGSLYYTAMPDPPGNMVFERYNSYRQLELAVEPDKANVYNAPRNAVVPKEGDLVLFSSALHHYVEPNRSKEDRYSIAFNTFVRGKIGSFRDVSELEL